MDIKEFFIRLALPQHRLQYKLYKFIKNKDKYPILIRKYLRDKYAVKYGVEIGENSKILGPVRFPHPRNIVIGNGVSIGENCLIFHNVTLGQNRGGYPKIGNNVVIGTGVIIIGDIEIGNNVTIGAGSLVIDNIESDCVCGGSPAKILYKKN